MPTASPRLASSTYLRTPYAASAASTPMITTTTISSIRVKPDSLEHAALRASVLERASKRVSRVASIAESLEQRACHAARAAGFIGDCWSLASWRGEKDAPRFE